jgi:putative drug exporter of the RND superfamily
MRQPRSPVSPTAATVEVPYPPPRPNGGRESVRPRRGLAERVAGWSAGHRKTAVFGWLLLVALLFAGGQLLGSKNLPSYDAGQSGQAERILNQVAPAQYSDYSESVLIQATAPGATFATDPAMRTAAAQLAKALAALPKDATGIRTPLSSGGQSSGDQASGGQALVSKDGRSALVTFDVPGNVPDLGQVVTSLQHAVAGVQAAHPDLRIAESGDASITQAINESLNFGQAEATSVPVTLVLLLLVFGALVAAGIPVLLAVTALTAAVGLITIASHWLPIGGSSFEVVVIIGMAVGVDYSLFYLRREREERAAGKSFPEALRIAARTSGRTILISGLTVMATMSGLFMVGGGPFAGMALGTITVVGLAMIGSLTVLPGLLAWLGPKADAGRIPFLGRRQAAARPSRVWAALSRRVVARPLVWGGIAAIAMLALAAPALGLRLGEPAADVPKGAAVVQTLDAIERAFPQAPAPAQVVVSGTDVTGPKVLAAVNALRADASANQQGAIHEPVTATSIGGGRALVIDVPLAGDGTNTASVNALATLRDQVLPATLGHVPGVSYAVAGDTAGITDDIHELKASLPAVFILVAVLAFGLLLAAFRSVAIPLVSIALNLLSVGAAYGLITLIFQDGRLQGPLDYTSFGGIIYWVPLLMFVFLFGISMDYHVFILSRIRERWARGSTAKEAIVSGIAASAGTVTSAALIMVAVFSIFTSLSLIDLKILGVGTAAAILIDATVVRGILLPAALALLGDRAWRLRAPRAASVAGREASVAE